MSVAPRICVKLLCSSLKWQSLEMLSGFWRPLIAGKTCLFFTQRKLLSLCFTAMVFLLLRMTKNYIFHVPLELFPQSSIHKKLICVKFTFNPVWLKKKSIKFITFPSCYIRNKPLCWSSFRVDITSWLSLLWQRLWVWHTLCCSFLNLPGKAAMENSE